MCGIVGYIGQQQAAPILIKGLQKLEYRGYDSAGMATVNGGIHRLRAVGKIAELQKKVATDQPEGTIGIAHTRWATHGGVTEENAHPHIGLAGKLAIVHNGIIENYRELKAQMSEVSFTSETDTEVLAHLIAKHYSGDLKKAVLTALSHVRGTYGLAVVHEDHPDQIIAARMGSPLVIGMADGEYYLGSDTTPMLAYTKEFLFLEDGEVAVIARDGVTTHDLNDDAVVKHTEQVDWDEAAAEKAGFDHFMIKEIYDQPTVLQDAIRGRYNLAEGTAYLGGLNMTDDEMREIDRIVLLACGTASYAGLCGKYAIERLAGIPVEVDVSSEFRYRDPIIDERTLVFGISQSGETADTIAALREAKRKGAKVRGIVNVVGSTIAREVDGGSYIHAGPELSVASTKVYSNMIAILLLYALQFGRLKRLTPATGQRVLHALREIPKKIERILESAETIKEIAQKYTESEHMFFLGRGANFPVALEGSLKLKEITYIHSEAYPGGELKHGPIALIEEGFPVVAIMTKNQLYDKMRSNVEEIKARGARVLVIATEGDEAAKELADDVIYVPDTMELLEPLLNTIPLQLFAYYVAVALGRDVDRPRNLAKSVTVE